MAAFTRDASTVNAILVAGSTGIGITINDSDGGGGATALNAGYAGVTDATASALMIASRLNTDQSALDTASCTISFPFSTSATGNSHWYFGDTAGTAMISEKASTQVASGDMWDACAETGENLRSGSWSATSGSYTVTTGTGGTKGTITFTLRTGVFDGDGNGGTTSDYLANGDAFCL